MRQMRNTMGFLTDGTVTGSLAITTLDNGAKALIDRDIYTGRATTIAVMIDDLVLLATPFLRRGKDIHAAIKAIAPTMGLVVRG